MLLYRMNAGFPVVDEGSEVLVPARDVVATTPRSPPAPSRSPSSTDGSRGYGSGSEGSITRRSAKEDR